MKLGHYGFTVDPMTADAQQIADLGFGTLWVNGGQIDQLGVLTDLLTATERVHVAPAIIPPDVYRPADVVDLYHRAEAETPGRLLIGLGSSQQKPLAALADYVDQLAPIPRDRRLLAAFGPHKLDIARDRFAGAIPSMVTPEYTAGATATRAGTCTRGGTIRGARHRPGYRASHRPRAPGVPDDDAQLYQLCTAPGLLGP